MMTQAIGFWHATSNDALIHPKHLVDPDWRCQDRAKLVHYLRSASPARQYLGYSYCRFDCGIEDHELGDSDLTDGAWCWPCGLAHYVEQHAIKLPDEFVAHAESLAWQPPNIVDPFIKRDLTFWRTWCRENS